MFPRYLTVKPFLTRPVLYYGLCLAFSSWFAFFIAVTVDLPNPYWAAMPAWVIFQPTRGLLLERAIYRFVGTFIGAAIGFAILLIPLPPIGQLIIFTVIIGATTTCSHIFRGTIAYGFFTTGLTLAIVIIPSIISPNDAINLAISRVVCTFIGCIVVTIILALFTPKFPIRSFYQKIHLLTSDVIFYSNQIISAESKEECQDIEQTILASINDINDNAAIAAAGSVNKNRKLRYIDAIVAASLDVMAASRAILTRNQRENVLPSEFSDDLLQLSKQISHKQPFNIADCDFFRKWQLDNAELKPEIKRLLYTIQQLLAAEDALLNNVEQHRSFISQNYSSTLLLPHRDWYMALNIALITCFIVFSVSLSCYLSELNLAEQVASGISIFAIVFGSFPLPQNNAPKLFVGVFSGVMVAMVYRFWVQPYIPDTFWLLTTLIPFLLLAGICRAHPKTAIPAIDANMAFLFAGHIGMPAADAFTILSTDIIYVLCAGIICGMFILLPRKPDSQALNAILSIQRDLDRMITSQSLVNKHWYQQSTRQLLRLMLHLSRAGKLGDGAPNGSLSTLNVGYAIIMLHAKLEQAKHDHTHYIRIKTILYILSLKPKGNLAIIKTLNEQIQHIEDSDIRRITEMLIDSLTESQPFFAYINELKKKST
ncbi:FUSC family protein [Orbus sturtevantii]|uniref:FUSC family protein n=1 Tax=Orbus sturtevantii TaxID=3074109 RepID=UPI00370DB44A